MKKFFNKKIAFFIAVILLFGSFTMIACNKKTDEQSDNATTQVEVSDKKDSKSEEKADTIEAEEKESEDTVFSNEKKPEKKKTPTKKSSSEKSKTWVPPVYKTVYHEEEGHYETQTYIICTPGKCGKRFPTEDAWYNHWQDYMASNGGVCDHMHDNPRKVTEQVYVVDKPAYTEKVLVKKGYWK